MNLNGIRGALKPSTSHICLSCLLRESPTSRRTSRRFLTEVPRIFPTPGPPLPTTIYEKPGRKNGSPPEKPKETTTNTTTSRRHGKSSASVTAVTLSGKKNQSPVSSDTVAGGNPKKALGGPRKRKERRLTKKSKPNPSLIKSEESIAEPQTTKDVVKKAMELAELLRPQVAAQKQRLNTKDKVVAKTVSSRARSIRKSELPGKPEKVIRSRRIPSLKIRRLSTKGKTPDVETGRSMKKSLSLTAEQPIKRLDKPAIEVSSAKDLVMTALDVEKRPVPNLSYGLERVLFNPGVYHLQDPRSRVFNFDPYLKSIMPVSEFDFNALKQYVTSSKDSSLTKLAKTYTKRYTGSTSSMTGMLAHFHFLLSQWRPINTKMLSKGFKDPFQSFTLIQRAPSAIFLRWQNGSYAIDADKEFESANVLSMLGKSLEKLLTLSTEGYEKYRKNNSDQISEEERNATEAFHYSTLGDFLMRSQLDAHDARLPGTGMFDLKTRAVLSIRMDVEAYEEGRGYQIKSGQGEFESFEREYYDMIRAAFLKYSLQVRMGRMDGIFVAFHNTERIFGFQYISLPEMDDTIHGQFDTAIGDQEFKLSLDLLNKILDKATKKFPEQSLRVFVETRESQTPFMYVFAEPVSEEQIQDLQTKNSAKIREFERDILGLTAEEEESEWSDIQARVQEAMAKDEKSVDEIKEAERTDSAAIAAAVDPEESDDEAEDEDEDEDADQGSDIEKNNLEGEEDIDSDEECVGNHGRGSKDPKDGTDMTESEGQEGIPVLASKQLPKPAPDAVEYGHNTHKAGATIKDSQAVDTATVECEASINSPVLEERHHNFAEPTAVQSSKDTEPLPEAAEYNDSSSDEDQVFLDDIARVQLASVGQPQSEILAMTLTLRNKLNGSYVLRPEKLQPSDDWSVEYSLNEVPNQVRARSLYQACQMRRRKQLDDQAADEDGESPSGRVDFFLRRLKEVTKESRKWRIAQDEIEAEQPVVVLGRSSAQTASGTVQHTAVV